MPKPVRKKKKFINKKEATTYRLIPGYVEDNDEVTSKNETPEEMSARKEEERAHGIFFDDTYNYMKHLKALDEQATMVRTETFRVGQNDETCSMISLPPRFFEMFSTDEKTEEKIDPDILAALEDAPLVKITEEDLEKGAVGGENFLEDDFISFAGGVLPKPVDEDFDSNDDFGSQDEFEEDEDDDFSIDRVEEDNDLSEDEGVNTASRPGRGTKEDDIVEAQTALILRNFEEGYGLRCSNQLSDEETEMPTEVDYENLKRILKQDKFNQDTVSWSEVLDDRSERSKVDTEKYLYEDDIADEIIWKDAPPSKPKFDCVSILSLNSNLHNRPTDIIPPKSEKKRSRGNSEQSNAPSVPAGMTLKELDAEMRESRRADKADTFRPKDETLDEKKTRKKAVKEERKDRRQEKKANKMVFTMEKTKLQKETAALSKAVNSVKIS